VLYTSGDRFVKTGREEDFVDAWRDLAEWTATEAAPGTSAMLLRDRDDASRFRSFGPWESIEQAEGWRQSEGFASRVSRIRGMVERFEAHALDVVASVGEAFP
jgi:heme-degrading monooxygenase HmoA